MRIFQDTFETRKRSFISAFSICMAVPLGVHHKACGHEHSFSMSEIEAIALS